MPKGRGGCDAAPHQSLGQRGGAGGGSPHVDLAASGGAVRLHCRRGRPRPRQVARGDPRGRKRKTAGNRITARRRAKLLGRGQAANIGGEPARGPADAHRHEGRGGGGPGETTGEAHADGMDVREADGEAPQEPQPNALRLAVYKRRAELSNGFRSGVSSKWKGHCGRQLPPTGRSGSCWRATRSGPAVALAASLGDVRLARNHLPGGRQFDRPSTHISAAGDLGRGQDEQPCGLRPVAGVPPPCRPPG
eukprot:jgi/Botrbrau1/22639/Bobra.176_1s0063.1